MSESYTAGKVTDKTALILQIENLSKEFSGFQVIRNLSLSVRKNTIHALIGPNGAGKTTLFNMISKFLQPSGGRIVFDGVNITRSSPTSVARQGLVRSFQISAVFSSLSVLDNIRVALQRQSGLATQFWLPSRALSRLDEQAMSLIESVGLAPYASTRAGGLSYGRKRALELATTIAMEPTLMLLDEPMAGMGHEDIELVTELIGRISKGRTVLMVEHNLSVVSRLSDYVTVLSRGEILSDGDYETVSKDPKVVEAYIGSEVDG